MFSSHSEKPRLSVNYIWLCAKGPQQTFPDYATRLPLHNFERMYDNAKRYPLAEFNFWLDYRQLTFTDRFFLDSHRYQFEAHHIRVRNLCEIPAYAENEGFAPDTNIALYARADYARILVLKFLHQSHPEGTTIYSDMDCEDVLIHSHHTQSTLQQHGIAYGAWDNRICNGFIGIHGVLGLNFLKDYLLPETEKASQKKLTNYFGAFAAAVNKFRKDVFPDLSLTQLGIVKLPPMRTSMPYKPGIYARVSPEFPTDIPESRDYV